MYKKEEKVLKCLADENRLKIIDMLSCGELSNKDLLLYLEITQPTLSHHIKILQDNDVIKKRIDKNTHYYSLNNNLLDNTLVFLSNIYKKKETCICFKKGRNV